MPPTVKISEWVHQKYPIGQFLGAECTVLALTLQKWGWGVRGWCEPSQAGRRRGGVFTTRPLMAQHPPQSPLSPLSPFIQAAEQGLKHTTPSHLTLSVLICRMGQQSCWSTQGLRKESEGVHGVIGSCWARREA